MSKEKVVMLIPSVSWYSKFPWKMVSHAALILTAILKNKYDFHILDANGADYSQKECIEKLRKLEPELVMVSGVSAEYSKYPHLGVKLAKAACPNCITVIGGIYPTVMEGEVLKDKNVDYIFMGHAEERIDDFLSTVLKHDIKKLSGLQGVGYRDESGKIIVNRVTTFLSDVKEHIKLDYSLVDIKPYLDQDNNNYQLNSRVPSATVITSYGCPYNCIFCASRTITGRKVVFRPIEDVLKEIEYLINKYNVQSLLFLDDCFLLDKKRIEKFLNEMIKRKYNLRWKIATVSAWHLDDDLIELLKKAGCTQMTISVESGNPRVLHKIIRKPLNLEIVPRIVKKCREVGIDLGANFVIGLPGETWEDIRETFSYAEKCDFDLAHFHIATPLPKTDLYNVVKEQNLLPDDFSFTNPSYFGFAHGFIKTDEFTPFELQILRSFEWDRINFSTPEKIEKVAKMMGITIEELNEHRKQTRRKVGIHY